MAAKKQSPSISLYLSQGNLGLKTGTWMHFPELRKYMTWLGENFPEHQESLDWLDEALVAGVINRETVKNSGD